MKVVWDVFANCVDRARFPDVSLDKANGRRHDTPDHLVPDITHPLHVPADGAGLQIRKVQELVPVHVHALYDLDLFLLLHHGLDDHNLRCVRFFIFF